MLYHRQRMLYPVTYYVVPTILLLIIIRKYRESKWGKCKNKVMLDGKIAIVTGANSGIGLQIAKDLASRNAHVILACRNLDKAKEACQLIRSNLSNQNISLTPMKLDLASLYSVKFFTDHVKKQYRAIDLLINNAGVSFPNKKRIETKDGLEVHFGVNHLGHFYLTNLLLEPLAASPASRVVIVSSSLHEKGKINVHDLNSLQSTEKANLYANSKLANIYFAQELAKRTKSTNIKVYACCPGWVYTGLFRHSIKWYHYILIAPIAFFFMRRPNEGAQTPIYCATDPALKNESGLLYRDCNHYTSKVIFYDSTSTKLWEESQNMINKIVGVVSVGTVY